jgi:hypothetical protein
MILKRFFAYNKKENLFAAPLVKYTFWCSLGEIYSDLTLNLTNILYIAFSFFPREIVTNVTLKV